MERSELLKRINEARAEASQWSEAERQMVQATMVIQGFINGNTGLREFITEMKKRVWTGLVKADNLLELEEITRELFPFGGARLVEHEAHHARVATEYGLKSSNGVLLARNEFGPTFFMGLTFVEFTEEMDEDLARKVAREIVSAPTDMSWGDQKSLP